MAVLGRVLDLVPVGKAVELAWDRTPLPTPRRQVQRRFADGRVMGLALADRTQRSMYCGAYERAESAILRRLLSPGATFVDAGAHVGWFTVLAASLVGPSGAVHAIEAFPDNARALRRNVAYNGAAVTRIHELALSDLRGTVTVGRQAGGDSGSITAGAAAAETLVEVPMATLDDLDTGDGPIALLKLDVEGLELRVLRAAPRTLDRVQAILVEINDNALEINGSSEAELLALLAARGLTDVEQVGDWLTPLRRVFAPGYRNVLVRRSLTATP